MYSKDFVPKIKYKPHGCFSCWRYCDCEDISEDAQTVRERMNQWIKIQGNKILVKKIETLDFESSEYIVPQAHIKVWYTLNIK